LVLRSGKLYRTGNATRVAVIGVRTLKRGKTVLELTPAPQNKVSFASSDMV
jgi:hypothetical protein